MKKIISTILVAVLLMSTLLALTSCNDTNDNVKLDVGFMNGPTGMGLAKLIHDNGGPEGNEKYAFHNYGTDPMKAITEVRNGTVDIVCLPTDTAAKNFNEHGGITVLAINCLNSLYILSDKNTTLSTVNDLNGKTIYTCLAGTPKDILEYALTSAGINAEVSTSYNGNSIANLDQLQLLVKEGKLPIVAMPEPKVTTSLLEIKNANNPDIAYSVDLDVSDIWGLNETTPITMGCIVAKTDFVNQNKDAINDFLAEYKNSIEFVGNSDNLETASNYIVESGIMAKLPPAKKALENLGGAIAYIDGSAMKSSLIAFYGAIGVATPTDSFFYEK